ncbi:hypothetical protein [Streptomyces sp. NPDC055105]|uniref:hypothetical protein n=1 Tax=Streptomyces sp. NPDC055105 TaxID=3365719 RepID=UPI0037D33CAF
MATEQPDPIRKGELPCIPAPEWEFHTWFAHPDGGGDMVPGQHARGVQVRRRVTYGGWEPVHPDHWAEEPPSDAGQAAAPWNAAADPTDGLTVQQADDLWDAVAIPGPQKPTFVEQHARVCRRVAEMLRLATAEREEVNDDAAPADQDARRERYEAEATPWYEVINPRNATTNIAMVHDDGSLYLPEGTDALTVEEFHFAAARGKAYRLIRIDEAIAVAVEESRKADEAQQDEPRCTCEDAGPEFAPADHYADCPRAEEAQ